MVTAIFILGSAVVLLTLLARMNPYQIAEPVRLRVDTGKKPGR